MGVFACYQRQRKQNPSRCFTACRKLNRKQGMYISCASRQGILVKSQNTES